MVEKTPHDLIVEHLISDIKKRDKQLRALQKGRDKTSYKEIAEGILEEVNILTDRGTKMMYLYNEKERYYECRNALDDIRTIILKELDVGFSINTVKEILEYIRLVTRQPLDNGYNNLICFNNGTYNILTNELLESSPKLFVSFRIRADYIPDKDTTEWDTYIGQIVDSDDVLKCQEAYGNILAPHYTTKKIFMHIGNQHSGKTKFTEILMDLFTRENYSPLTLHDFSNGYNVADLYGKRANFGGDINAEKLFKETSLIKRLTGGDELQARKIYCPPFQFVNRAKLFLSGNYVPKVVSDVDPIFTGRFEFIHHPNQFAKDNTIFDTYTTKDMKEQQVKWLVDGYLRLHKNKWIFTNQLNDDKLQEIFLQQKFIKPGFRDWLLTCIPDIDNWIRTEDLCRECFDFCFMHDLERPSNVTQFGRMLNEQSIINVVKERKRGVNGYRGIKL